MSTEYVMQKTFGKQLRELRGTKLLDDVANEIGLTAQSLSRYERGDRTPDVFMAKKIADYYGISLDVLLGDVTAKSEDDIIAMCNLIGISLEGFKKLLYCKIDSFSRVMNDLIETGQMNVIIMDMLELERVSNDMLSGKYVDGQLSDYEMNVIDPVRYRAFLHYNEILDAYDARKSKQKEYDKTKEAAKALGKQLMDKHYQELLESIRKGKLKGNSSK